MRLTRFFFFVTTGLIAAAAMAGECKPVNGNLRSEGFTDGCASPIGLCTRGRLTGGVQGDFVFVAQSLSPSDTPGVFFYTGEINVAGNDATLTCRDAGAYSFVNGSVVDLCTIAGGTGKLAGASGDIKIFGIFANNVGDSDYRGTICTP